MKILQSGYPFGDVIVNIFNPKIHYQIKIDLSYKCLRISIVNKWYKYYSNMWQNIAVASRLHFVKCLRKFFKPMLPNYGNCIRNINVKNIRCKFLRLVICNSLFLPVMCNSHIQITGEMKRINIPEPHTFRHTFQLHQSANQAINSATLMLNSIFQTLVTAYAEYSILLEKSISVLRLAVEMRPLLYDYAGVDSQLTIFKTEMSVKKNSILESLFVLQESVKLLEGPANISFLVGSETSASLASSHWYNIQQEVIIQLHYYYGIFDFSSLHLQFVRLKNWRDRQKLWKMNLWHWKNNLLPNQSKSEVIHNTMKKQFWCQIKHNHQNHSS